MRNFLIILGIVIAACSCSRRAVQDTNRRLEPTASAADRQTDTTAKIGACKLLSSGEIETILGEPLQQSVASYRSESGFAISQCYFGLTTASKSVAITLTRRGIGKDAKEPREYWMEKFHPGTGPHDENAGEEESEGRPRVEPVKIEGLGDEAYWVDSGQTGALYALQRDLFIRVAIGGSDSKDARIARSKQLAEIALKRL